VLSRIPKFGAASANALRAVSPWPGLISHGKQSPFRADRTTLFRLGDCARNPLKLELDGTAGIVSHVLIGCGKHARCLKTRMQVTVNGHSIAHDVDGLRNSSYRVHYDFAHRLSARDEPVTSAVNDSRLVTRIDLCRLPPPSVAIADYYEAPRTAWGKPVLVERIVVVAVLPEDAPAPL